MLYKKKETETEARWWRTEEELTAKSQMCPSGGAWGCSGFPDHHVALSLVDKQYIFNAKQAFTFWGISHTSLETNWWPLVAREKCVFPKWLASGHKEGANCNCWNQFPNQLAISKVARGFQTSLWPCVIVVWKKSNFFYYFNRNCCCIKDMRSRSKTRCWLEASLPDRSVFR